MLAEAKGDPGLDMTISAIAFLWAQCEGKLGVETHLIPQPQQRQG